MLAGQQNLLDPLPNEDPATGRTEMSLHVLAYNLKRMLQNFGHPDVRSLHQGIGYRGKLPPAPFRHPCAVAIALKITRPRTANYQPRSTQPRSTAAVVGTELSCMRPMSGPTWGWARTSDRGGANEQRQTTSAACRLPVRGPLADCFCWPRRSAICSMITGGRLGNWRRGRASRHRFDIAFEG